MVGPGEKKLSEASRSARKETEGPSQSGFRHLQSLGPEPKGMDRQRHQAKIKDDGARRVAAPGARNHEIGECHEKSREEPQPSAQGVRQVPIGMQQQIKPESGTDDGNPIDEPIFLLQQKGAQEGYPHPVGGREKTALTRADSLDRR